MMSLTYQLVWFTSWGFKSLNENFLRLKNTACTGMAANFIISELIKDKKTLVSDVTF
jgi:hypothetical protein